MNIDFEKMKGLVPAIVQNSLDGRVLMLGYMNEEALQKTKELGLVTFWSRSKERLWTKGETSGNTLAVDSLKADCDQDTILIQATPQGPTCHTGTASCFEVEGAGFLSELSRLISKRKLEMPEGSYTTSLFEKGLPEITAKIEEEAEEVCRAAKSEGKQRVIEEASDLLYHTLVLLAQQEVELEEVLKELKSRN